MQGYITLCSHVCRGFYACTTHFERIWQCLAILSRFALITAITRLCCVITRHVQWFIRSVNSQSLVSQKAAQFSAFKVNSEMAPPSVCLFVLCSVCMSFSCCTAIKAAILSMNSALIGGVCVYSWVMLCFFSGERAAVGAGRGQASRLRRRWTALQ